MIDIFNKTNGGSVLALEKVPKREVSKYGVINPRKKFSGFCSINKLVEKPKPKDAPSNLSVVGRYILNSKIFEKLDNQKKGYGGEIQLTDSLVSLVDKPGLFGVEFEGKRFDCGSKLGFIEANLFFGLNDNDIKKNLIGILKDL